MKDIILYSLLVALGFLLHGLVAPLRYFWREITGWNDCEVNDAMADAYAQGRDDAVSESADL